MRITFQSQYRDASAAINEASSQLVKIQTQVSTGYRVNKPSDDPSASSHAINERAEMAMVEQYSRAANNMASRLNVTDTVLSHIIEKLTAATSAVMSAQGSESTVSQREAAAQKLEGLRASLIQDFNTTFHGSYLFAGAAATTRPFVEGAGGTVGPYAGSTSEVQVDVGQDRAVVVGFDGDEIARGADVDDIFAVLEDVIAAVRAGDATGMETGAAGIRSAFERASTAQTRVGAGLNAITNEQAQLDEMKMATTRRLSALEDADMVEAVSAMRRAEAAYQAALGAVGTANRVSLMDFLG
jgi:flagellar hook-associated protein 3 FlgL